MRKERLEVRACVGGASDAARGGVVVMERSTEARWVVGSGAVGVEVSAGRGGACSHSRAWLDRLLGFEKIASRQNLQRWR